MGAPWLSLLAEGDDLPAPSRRVRRRTAGGRWLRGDGGRAALLRDRGGIAASPASMSYIQFVFQLMSLMLTFLFMLMLTLTTTTERQLRGPPAPSATRTAGVDLAHAYRADVPYCRLRGRRSHGHPVPPAARTSTARTLIRVGRRSGI